MKAAAVVEVNVHEAKTTRVAVSPRAGRRVPGRDAGQGRIADDFDAPLPPAILPVRKAEAPRRRA